MAVIDAAIEMFSEGVLDPDLDEVAARCGLSPRSVYRYFDDRTELLREAIDRHFESVRPLTLIHAMAQGDLDGRIERFVQARVTLYEAVAAASRAARRRSETSDLVREQVELTRARLREQVDEHFAPELRALPARRRRAVAAAVDALCQFEGLDHYRLHRGASVDRTRRLLLDALHLLLDPPA
ncbi:MAG: TetR/AcrR family transcriptional regulator [Acidimicrobiales bacterium]|nr:TetR/AcrR family transcriptional regulator [Acidimicrobiales bacterium]